MTTAPPLQSRQEVPPDIEPLTAHRRMSYRALWTVYTLTLRQHLHGKRWMAAAALFLLPVGLALFIRRTAPAAPTVWMDFLLGFMFIPQGLLPLIALLYASGMIQDEQEEQTITYLLIRPIAKWAMYLAKLLATLTTTVVLTTIFTALTYFTIYAGGPHEGVDVMRRCLTAIATHCLAVSAYCCLFGLISLFTRRTLIVGILYAAIFEGLLANLPLSVRLVTVIYYTRIIAYRTLDFVAPLPRGGSVDIAADAWRLDVLNDPKLLEHPQRATCVLILVVGSVACTILAAFMCSRREFHVKTPEKN